MNIRGLISAAMCVALAATFCAGPSWAGVEEGLAAFERGDYRTARRILTVAAKRGDTTAQFKLGNMYLAGLGVSKDLREGTFWFRKAAEGGLAEAQYTIAAMYALGEGVPQDYAEARRWYLKAAAQGEPESLYSLGYMAANGQGGPRNETEAAEWFQKAAERGHVSAQYELAGRYQRGAGVPQDGAKAMDMFRKAAEQGFAPAEHSLGFAYATGQGVPHDLERAMEWFRKAAEQGVAESQVEVGAMYFSGQGVAPDPVEAFAWFDQAAAQGVDVAGGFRNHTAKRLTPSQLAHAQALSREYFEKYVVPFQSPDGTIGEARRGYTPAVKPFAGDFAKGVEAYQRGDYTTALREWGNLAELGSFTAQYNLGSMYYTGIGVSKDFGKAAEWYRQAAEAGHGDAQRMLGIMYSKGEGVPESKVRALAWLNVAAANMEEGQAAQERRLAELRGMLASKMTPIELQDARTLSRDYYQKYVESVRHGDHDKWIRVPGGTLASPVLQRDTVLPALVLAGSRECMLPQIVNTSVLTNPIVIGKAWEERWEFDRCGEMIALHITYTPDGHGGTDISVTEEKEPRTAVP